MKEAVVFAEHATRFCEFIENCSKFTRKARLVHARVLLIELHRAAPSALVVPPDGFDGRLRTVRVLSRRIRDP